MRNTILTFVILSIGIASCKTSDKTVASPKAPLNCDNTAYSYTADINPIMQENCTRCHNTNMKAGYNFNELESVKRAAENGYLLGTIKHMDGYDAMPRMAGQLDQATIDKIECWIKTGMK
jgi:mono/diheme cytochrome c family protein